MFFPVFRVAGHWGKDGKQVLLDPPDLATWKTEGLRQELIGFDQVSSQARAALAPHPLSRPKAAKGTPRQGLM